MTEARNGILKRRKWSAIAISVAELTLLLWWPLL